MEVAKLQAKSEEIRRRLYSIWPHLEKMNSLGLSDKFYEYPSLEQVKLAIASCPRYRKITYQDFKADCDKKSKWLDGDIKEYCLDKTQHYTWTFGWASGFIWNGELRNHTANIFLTKERIYLFDSSGYDDSWEADSKKDLIIKVEI
jgi:hypothetical protein